MTQYLYYDSTSEDSFEFKATKTTATTKTNSKKYMRWTGACIAMMITNGIARKGLYERALGSVVYKHPCRANNMNIWQTIDFLTGMKRRRRYNYDGYKDPKEMLSWLKQSQTM